MILRRVHDQILEKRLYRIYFLLASTRYPMPYGVPRRLISYWISGYREPIAHLLDVYFNLSMEETSF